MAREYHIAAVGGSDDDEVSVDLADVLNALGAQDWELTTAVPLKDSDTLLLILSRELPRHRRPASETRDHTSDDRAGRSVGLDVGMSASAQPWRATSDGDFPAPWQITDGPHLIAQTMFDGRAWLFDAGAWRATAAANRRSQPARLEGDPPQLLPVQTREAILTDGRSEAARVAQFDDPAGCVALGRDGDLHAPPGLARFPRT